MVRPTTTSTRRSARSGVTAPPRRRCATPRACDGRLRCLHRPLPPEGHRRPRRRVRAAPGHPFVAETRRLSGWHRCLRHRARDAGAGGVAAARATSVGESDGTVDMMAGTRGGGRRSNGTLDSVSTLGWGDTMPLHHTAHAAERRPPMRPPRPAPRCLHRAAARATRPPPHSATGLPPPRLPTCSCAGRRWLARAHHLPPAPLIRRRIAARRSVPTRSPTRPTSARRRPLRARARSSSLDCGRPDCAAEALGARDGRRENAPARRCRCSTAARRRRRRPSRRASSERVSRTSQAASTLRRPPPPSRRRTVDATAARLACVGAPPQRRARG